MVNKCTPSSNYYQTTGLFWGTVNADGANTKLSQTHAALVAQRALFGLGLGLPLHDSQEPFRQLEPRVVNGDSNLLLRFLETRVEKEHLTLTNGSSAVIVDAIRLRSPRRSSLIRPLDLAYGWRLGCRRELGGRYLLEQ